MVCFRRSAGGAKTAGMTTKAITPMGTLMKKIQCHERWSTKKPPSNGPSTVETPKTPPISPE